MTRLQIATRIHFILKRRLGASIDIETLLRGADEAREVLWVCEGTGDPELAALADAFREASRGVVPELADAPRLEEALAAPQARDSRFADSRPHAATGYESTLFQSTMQGPDIDAMPAAPQRRWVPARRLWRAMSRAMR